MERRQIWVSDSWKKIKLSGLLKEEDTAVIFYSMNELHQRLMALDSVFEEFNVLHTVAIKTQPHPEILKGIVEAGFGLEAASFEEVRMAIDAGADPDKIAYNSPVKTRREIAYCEAHLHGLQLNANSFEELERLSENTLLNVGLRINPLVSAGSVELYDVSGAESKFGVSIDQRDQIIDHAIRYSVNTLHVHVGSQVSRIERVVDAIVSVLDLADVINAVSEEKYGERLIQTINIGGGLPAASDPKESLKTMKEYVRLIRNKRPDLPESYKLITEFGQWVHKHNGVVYSEVEYVKQLPRKSIAYVHVGADLFMREAYTSLNTLEFVCLSEAGNLLISNEKTYDLAGPLCFNGDYLGKDCILPSIKPGDVLAIPASGANAYGLWSRHCSRTIPTVFVDNALGEMKKVSARTSVY